MRENPSIAIAKKRDGAKTFKLELYLLY